VYQIWTIPAVIVVLAMTVDMLRQRRLLRQALRLLLTIVVLATLFIAIRLLVLQDVARVLSSTVYPGARMSSGGTHQTPLFSGPVSLSLGLQLDPTIVGSNLSEISIGWNVLMIPTFVLMISKWSVRSTATRLGNSGHTWTIVAYTGLLVWARIPFPVAVAEFLPLRIIPGDRAGQIFSALLPLGALHYLTTENPSKRFAEMRFEAEFSALVASISTAMSLVAVRTFVPGLSVVWIWGLAIIVGLAMFGIVLGQRKSVFMLPMVLFSLSATVLVNPLVKGLGELVDSSAAKVLRTTVLDSNEPTGRVATDDIFVDALVMANGLAQVNGQQEWGPNRASYSILDPDSEFEDQWNRGASYVVFGWSTSPEQPIQITGEFDFVRITAYPCSREILDLGVTWIISLVPLELECLTLRGSFLWQGIDRQIYEINP